MAVINRQIVLASRPEGVPQESNFRLVETELPSPSEGQFLVRTNYVSVDPYMRGRMTDRKSYVAPIPVGGVVEGGAVGTVIESRHEGFKPGAVVLGFWGWQEYALIDGRGVHPIDPKLAPISTALGVLGMPGMTAYFGLFDVGRPKPGETVFVTGAAGAVGSLVGQLAKIHGCYVAGSAGSDDKVEFLKNEAHFDVAFNYRTAGNLGKAIDAACPNGIDVYFDNTGGPITDAVFPRLNMKARVAVCGQIDQYNTPDATGPRILWHLIVKRARAEGFLVSDYAERFPEAQKKIAQWLKEGRLTYRETVHDGLESTPKAFIGLFTGENTGKMLVRVS